MTRQVTQSERRFPGCGRERVDARALHGVGDVVASLMRQGYARVSAIGWTPATRISPAAQRRLVVSVRDADAGAFAEDAPRRFFASVREIDADALAEDTLLFFLASGLRGFDRTELCEATPQLPCLLPRRLTRAAALVFVAPTTARHKIAHLRARVTLAASTRAGAPG